jgi:hypothetical protein
MGASILGVADEKHRKENLFNSRRYSSLLSLFIFQDLKEWRAKKKSRTICTLKVAFFVIDPAEEFDITV